MKYFIKILFSLIIIIAISCEKDITVDLPQPEQKIVLEGAIENGEYPYLYVTKNVAYFDKVDTNTLINMIALDSSAVITVTHENIVDTLHPMIDFNNIIPIKYQGNIKGEIGKTYILNAKIFGKTYTASTKIPVPVPLDSVKFKLRQPDSPDDSTGFLWMYATDPDTAGNYYRLFSKTLGKDNVFVHPTTSVADDQYFNGVSVEYRIYRGYNPLVGEEPDQSQEDVPRWVFIKGETVVLKFCSLDVKHYNFWYSIELQNASDGNPFASPVTIKSNIEGGALGIWGGYGSYLDTIYIDNSILIN